MSMKKLLLILTGVAAVCIMSTMIIRQGGRSDLEKLQDAMAFAHYDVYVDPQYGYMLYYPTLFSKEENDWQERGGVRFAYHGHGVNLIIDCRVAGTAPLDAARNDVLEEGDSDLSDDYKYFSHSLTAVGHRLSLILTYPRKAERAVQELIYNVKIWDPYPARKIPLATSPNGRSREESKP